MRSLDSDSQFVRSRTQSLFDASSEPEVATTVKIKKSKHVGSAADDVKVAAPCCCSELQANLRRNSQTGGEMSAVAVPG